MEVRVTCRAEELVESTNGIAKRDRDTKRFIFILQASKGHLRTELGVRQPTSVAYPGIEKNPSQQEQLA